jgi:hypothetical protein
MVWPLSQYSRGSVGRAIGPVPRCRRGRLFGDDFRRLLDLRIVLFIEGSLDLRGLRRSRRALDDNRLSRRAAGWLGHGIRHRGLLDGAIDLRTANPLSLRSRASGWLPQVAWRSENHHLRRWSATVEIMVRSNPLATEPEAVALSLAGLDGALRDRTASGLS